jgi:hypothetical protein
MKLTLTLLLTAALLCAKDKDEKKQVTDADRLAIVTGQRDLLAAQLVLIEREKQLRDAEARAVAICGADRDLNGQTLTCVEKPKKEDEKKK